MTHTISDRIGIQIQFQKKKKTNSVPVDNPFNVQSLFVVYDAFANRILFSKDIL